MATAQNRPNSVQTVSTEAFMSLVGGDMHQPQYFSELIETRPGEAAQFDAIMRFLGRDIAIHEPSYFDFSDRGQTRSVRTTGAAAPGAGLPQTYTIAVADRFGALDPVRVGDVIQYYNAATPAVVFAVVTVATPAAHTFTVEPFNSTDAIPAVAANAILTLITGTSAYGDATGQPDPITPIVDRNTHYLSQLKDTWAISGWEQTDMIWLSNGKWVSELERTTLDRISESYNTDILTAKGLPTALNPNIPASIALTTQMTGLIPWAQAGGNTQTYIAGNLALGDFDNLSDTLAAGMVGRDYSLLMSTAVGRQFDDVARASAPNGGVIYGTFSGEGRKQIALSLQFSSIMRGAFSFTKIPLTALDNLNGLGATTLAYKNMVIGVPMGVTTNSVTGKTAHAFELTHKEGNGLDRGWEQWWDGAGTMNQIKIGSQDVTYRHYRRHVGTWPKWAQGFFLMNT